MLKNMEDVATKKPDDFVIATGKQFTVNFVNISAKNLGIKIRWSGTGINEKELIKDWKNYY